MTASDKAVVNNNGADAFSSRKGDWLRLRWLGEDIVSWRLAWDDGLGRHAASNVGWREDGQIGIAAVESIEADLGANASTIPTRTRLERRPEVVK